MSTPRSWSRYRPSGGFVLICLTYLATALFFCWGGSTPDLDRVWTLHHLLKTGRLSHLDRDDYQLLYRALGRHEELGRSLLDGAEIGLVSAHDDGWIEAAEATILRTAKSGPWSVMTLDVQTPKDLLPISIVVKGHDWQQELKAEHQGSIPVELPAPSRGEVIRVSVKGGSRAVHDTTTLGIRIRFERRS